jgi:thioesterase domain-containing protein
MVSTDEVVRFLGLVDFPADRDEIVERATEAEAPPDVRRALRAMPAEVYRNKAEVARSAHVDADHGDSLSHKALQARDKKHPRIAQHEREVQPPASELEPGRRLRP